MPGGAGRWCSHSWKPTAQLKPPETPTCCHHRSPVPSQRHRRVPVPGLGLCSWGCTWDRTRGHSSHQSAAVTSSFLRAKGALKRLFPQINHPDVLQQSPCSPVHGTFSLSCGVRSDSASSLHLLNQTLRKHVLYSTDLLLSPAGSASGNSAASS